MSRNTSLLLMFVTLMANADTLQLRNGTSISGSWMGADPQQITFLVNNQIQAFPRADVSTVTFGVDPPQQPTTPSSKPVDPELIGVVYLQGESGNLTQLMRIAGETKTARRTFGIKIPSPERFQFTPEPSKVRIKAGQKMAFVVKLANGVDPGNFTLLVLRIAKSDNKTPHPPSHFNIAKFSEASYLLTPTSDLAAGEYGFHARDSNDLYCFGVDD